MQKPIRERGSSHELLDRCIHRHNRSMQHRRCQHLVSPTREHGGQYLVQCHAKCIRLAYDTQQLACVISEAKIHIIIRRQEKNMIDLRVADNGATRPCTVLILACAGSTSPLPELAVGAVVGCIS